MKGSRDEKKPLKSYFRSRIDAEGIPLREFVCGTLFSAKFGRVRDIVRDWIASVKGWKPHSLLGPDGKRHLSWESAAAKEDIREFVGGYVHQLGGRLDRAVMHGYVLKMLEVVSENLKVEKRKVAFLLYATAKGLPMSSPEVLASLGVKKSRAAYRLLGYENRRLAAKDFNDDRKDSGEMGAGHTMTAFYELVPVGASNEVAKTDQLRYQKTTAVESGELLTVKLRYKEPQGAESRLVETPVTAEAISRREGPSEDFRFASAVVEFALALRDSKFRGESSIAAAIKRAKQAKGEDVNGYRAEFIRLAEAAELHSADRSGRSGR